MDRRLGEPLPHQLSNPTRAHPCAINLWQQKHASPLRYAVLAVVSNCCPPHKGRLLTRYSPVRHWSGTEVPSPFDLNVLCTPPAFILSQDQTLKQIVYPPPKWLDSVWAIYLSFFYFLELCYSLFLTDLYSHLLNLLCTSIFCCSIVKFQSLITYARAATRFRESLSIIPQPFRFVKRFFKTFLSFFQALFVTVAFLAATRLLYHNSFRLSIGFWKFLKKFFKPFSNPSTRSSCCISYRFRDSLNILPLFPLFVNTFFQSFLSL